MADDHAVPGCRRGGNEERRGAEPLSARLRLMVEDAAMASTDRRKGAGVAVKPTTLGTNLVVQLPQEKVEGLGMRGTATVVDFKETKNMARWVPGLMRELAADVLEQIYKEKTVVKRLSWKEHVANGHVPFRKDCRDCQLASAKDRPHRRIKHSQAYVLSLDVAGPMKKGWDIDGKACKNLLVGAYTWPKPGEPGVEEVEDKGEGKKAGEAKEDQEADKEEQIPKMEDYWTMSSDGSAVIRVHKHHRKVRFFRRRGRLPCTRGQAGIGAEDGGSEGRRRRLHRARGRLEKCEKRGPVVRGRIEMGGSDDLQGGRNRAGAKVGRSRPGTTSEKNHYRRGSGTSSWKMWEVSFEKQEMTWHRRRVRSWKKRVRKG